jgi:hypothetical protein
MVDCLLLLTGKRQTCDLEELGSYLSCSMRSTTNQVFHLPRVNKLIRLMIMDPYTCSCDDLPGRRRRRLLVNHRRLHMPPASGILQIKTSIWHYP